MISKDYLLGFNIGFSVEGFWSFRVSGVEVQGLRVWLELRPLELGIQHHDFGFCHEGVGVLGLLDGILGFRLV